MFGTVKPVIVISLRSVSIVNFDSVLGLESTPVEAAGV